MNDKINFFSELRQMLGTSDAVAFAALLNAVFEHFPVSARSKLLMVDFALLRKSSAADPAFPFASEIIQFKNEFFYASATEHGRRYFKFGYGEKSDTLVLAVVNGWKYEPNVQTYQG